MALTAAIAFTAIGAGVSAVGQVKAGNAAARTAEVNARSIEGTSEINAQLIEKSAAANAGILDFNARMADAQARDATRRGFTAEGTFGLQLRGFIGTQKAGYAGQGVEVDTGSPVEVAADTAYQGRLDQLTLLTDAAREAWGYKVEAENTRMQQKALVDNAALEAASTRRIGRIEALSQRLGGSYAKSASRYGAASTIIGAVGSTAIQLSKRS